MKTREKLLMLLKRKKGVWVSGELMRKELNVSRSAISKHIRTLNEEGYHIDASTNRGYLLKDTDDVLSSDEIAEKLTAIRFRKSHIICFEETDSTNSQARKMAQNGAVEGTVVVAERQRLGRGRKQRVWFSSSRDGLYFSVILRPNISPMKAPIITLIGAVSVTEALIRMTGADIRIKWPNDLLINGKKMCGILTESMTEPDAIDYIVMGIGVNVNTENFPDGIESVATSLKKDTGKTFKRASLLAAILNQLDHFYDCFLDSDIKPVMDLWRQRCDILGKPVRVQLISGAIEGIAKTVEDDGVLVVEDNGGRQHRILSGDVHHLRSGKGDTSF